MKMWKERTWQQVTTGTEATATLFGKLIFQTDFRDSGKKVAYKGLQYDIYTVFIDGEERTLAMTEISNGVYDFLIETY